MNNNFSPLVSIIIPVYNGANYLREAIDSALAQTYKNIETIVVNDGSTDNTEEISKSYGKKIRYFYKKNGGTSTALNVGVKNMKGQYFSWLSHDDMYYPDKIKKQIEELEKLKDKNTIMMSDLDGINEKYVKIYKTNYSEHIKQFPLREKSKLYPVIYNRTHGCTLLIPKVCFEKVGLFNEKSLVAQDFEFFYRAFSKFPHKLVSQVLVTARDSSSRQGRRSVVRGSTEYSDLYISIIKKLSNSDIKLLATDKLSFFYDMQDFFTCTGYDKALKFINKKIIKNLQITPTDLVGNKFNGFDLHLSLQEYGIDSKCLVLNKKSEDKNTFSYNFDNKDATKDLLSKKIFFETDILHLQLIHTIIDINFLPIITRLKPTVISLHDPYFLSGHCIHHFDCKKWQSHCKDCPYLTIPFKVDSDKTALNYELKKQAIKNSKITAIVASKWMYKKVKKSPIWKEKKVYLLPFGINQNIFVQQDSTIAKRRLNIPTESLVLMFRADHGIYSPYKGLDIIKKALANLNTSKKITLISVGDKGMLNEFNDKYNIIEYDWLNNDKLLASLYQACDIFLMPSRQETFGMMAIEAMSCGRMVLSLDCEGSALPEVISSPICGLAINETNFTKELNRLINNPKEIISRGKKSLIFAKKNYSKYKYVNKIIKIYKDVIKNHSVDEDTEMILLQLKKYKSKESSDLNYFRNSNDLFNNTYTPLYRIILRKLIPIEHKQKMIDLFRITFYKVDKIFPKFFRLYVKLRIRKYDFVKKYLIID